MERIESFALASFNEMTLKVPVERGDILSLLHREGVEVDQQFNEEEESYRVTVRVNRDHPIYGRIAPFLLDKPETVEESW